jgi:hemolysin-activating ACP:hemolysin acyltransferase
MKIKFVNRWRYHICVEDGNLEEDLELDIQETMYAINEDGTKNYGSYTHDITDKSMEMISNLLYDMCEYRSADFNSTELIKMLVSLLPYGKSDSLVEELFENMFEEKRDELVKLYFDELPKEEQYRIATKVKGEEDLKKLLKNEE